MIKKLCRLILISLCSVSLVACGENASATTTPEKEEVETDSTTEYANIDGERNGQGVIKPDDELEICNEEAEHISSEENNAPNVIESKEESESQPQRHDSEAYSYIPMDEFWLSDTEFDLIAWFEANGAVPRYCDLYGNENREEIPDCTAYVGVLYYPSIGCWNVIIGSDNYSAIRNSVNADKIYRTVFEYNSKEKNDVVMIKSDVNDFRTYRDHLIKMDEAMRKIKADPTNPTLNMD